MIDKTRGFFKNNLIFCIISCLNFLVYMKLDTNKILTMTKIDLIKILLPVTEERKTELSQISGVRAHAHNPIFIKQIIMVTKAYQKRHQKTTLGGGFLVLKL